MSKKERLISTYKEFLSKAQLIAFRHGPKDGEDLSPEGEKLCRALGCLVRPLVSDIRDKIRFVATSKTRTHKTLKLVFGKNTNISQPKKLDFPNITETDRERIKRLMKSGKAATSKEAWLNLEIYDGEHPTREMAPRMKKGLENLIKKSPKGLTVYCGHSPCIEFALVENGCDFEEIGELLEPLEMFFLKLKDGKLHTIGRISFS